MLNKTELGAAIASAIKAKKANGSIKTDKEVADFFGIKPPSLTDWKNRGTIGKEKLSALFSYFSDVVGPEHWGLTPDTLAIYMRPEDHGCSIHGLEQQKKPYATERDEHIAKIVQLLNQTSDTGIAIVLDKATDISKQYPATKSSNKQRLMIDINNTADRLRTSKQKNKSNKS